MTDAEENLICGGCDRVAHNCYCRLVECAKCGDITHRYNLKHIREDEENFYQLTHQDQDDEALCKDCFYNIDSDDDTYETESDIEESEEYNDDEDNSDY